MKIIIQTNLNPIQQADGYCLKEILKHNDSDDLFIISSGNREEPFSFCGIEGYSFSNQIINKLNPLIRKGISVVLWPDLSVFYIKKVLKYFKEKVNTDRIEEIICFSGDYSSQILGLKIKKAFPDIRLTSVLFDPLPAENFIYKNKLCLYCNRRSFSKRFFSEADQIFCTEGLYNYYSKKFVQLRNKMFVCGIPFFNPSSFVVPVETENETVKLVYCGSLNPKVRNINLVLSFLCTLESSAIDYNMTFIGSFSDSQKVAFEPFNVSFTGWVSKDRIPEYYSSANILVCLGNNNNLQTPSKLIEYFSTGKKVISLESIANTQSMILTKKYHNGFVWTETTNQDELVDFILQPQRSFTDDELDYFHLYEGNTLYEQIIKQ